MKLFLRFGRKRQKQQQRENEEPSPEVVEDVGLNDYNFHEDAGQQKKVFWKNRRPSRSSRSPSKIRCDEEAKTGEHGRDTNLDPQVTFCNAIDAKGRVLKIAVYGASVIDKRQNELADAIHAKQEDFENSGQGAFDYMCSHLESAFGCKCGERVTESTRFTRQDSSFTLDDNSRLLLEYDDDEDEMPFDLLKQEEKIDFQELDEAAERNEKRANKLEKEPPSEMKEEIPGDEEEKEEEEETAIEEEEEEKASIDGTQEEGESQEETIESTVIHSESSHSESTTTKEKDDEPKNLRVYSIQKDKPTEKVGLSLGQLENEETGVYIFKVKAESKFNGLLQCDSRIVSINGEACPECARKAMELMKAAPEKLEIAVDEPVAHV